jgi:hypothetical protein
MPPIGNINSSSNLVLPTLLPDPIVKQPTNPVPSKNSDGFSKDIAELKQLFPNAPKFEVNDNSYIRWSLNATSIPKAYAERFEDINSKEPTFRLIKDLNFVGITIPKGSIIYQGDNEYIQDYNTNFGIKTPQGTNIVFEKASYPGTGQAGYSVTVITKNDKGQYVKNPPAFSVGAFAVTKDGNVQSLIFKDGSPKSSNSNDKVKLLNWKAQDPQVAATVENNARWQAVIKLLKSLPL